MIPQPAPSVTCKSNGSAGKAPRLFSSPPGSRWFPQNYRKLETEEQVKLMEKLIEIMEDDDDVQNIWHNWEE